MSTVTPRHTLTPVATDRAGDAQLVAVVARAGRDGDRRVQPDGDGDGQRLVQRLLSLRNCITWRHSFTLKPNSRGPLTCIRLYDRLPRPETGSLLTVTPPVMNGPPSPAAWMGMGSVRTSTASPVTHVGLPRRVADAHRLDRVGRVQARGPSPRPPPPSRSPAPARRAPGWPPRTRRPATRPPVRRPGRTQPTCSNNGAGPLCRSSAAATSASSWSSDTGRAMRASCPAASSTCQIGA